MLMRLSMTQEPWWAKQMEALHRGVYEALGEDTDRKDLHNWHPTRQLEYPWLLEHCPPEGRLLDIGSNPQFHCALLGMGYKNITAHATYEDVKGLGRVFPWENEHRGGIFMEKCYKRYRHDITWVLGMFEDLRFVQDGAFDTIYNISVVEHFEPDYVPCLMNESWRMLKPGGRMCFTCDWFIDYGVGEGKEHYVINHDLGPYLKAWGVEPEQGFDEIPWHPDFFQPVWDTEDVMKSVWAGERLGVYAFTVRKPL